MAEPGRLRERIEAAAAAVSSGERSREARVVIDDLLSALEAGDVRSAERGDDGTWNAVPWVKRGILLGFQIGKLTDLSPRGGHPGFTFFDKDTYPLRALSLDDSVRVVPGGSSIRRGAYVAPGVVCMPPMYVNVGAHIGAGTMVDSHALVGSCAQIGERVHPVPRRRSAACSSRSTRHRSSSRMMSSSEATAVSMKGQWCVAER
jgi:2,3,4,5-tetrahydropyridine-2-carboxylate N-succinyltransferase